MLIDSNILVYSLNISSPKCLAARKFLNTWAGKFYVAQQNVLETIRIVSHPKFPHPVSPPAAVEALTNIINAGQLITPAYEALSITLELIKKHKLSGVRAFDAYLAATMISHGISEIATDNEKDFQIFKQVKVINLALAGGKR